MGFLVFVAGVVQMVSGIAAFAVAQSAIHQILGATTFGFGAVCFALGIIINKLDAIKRVNATDGGHRVDMSMWSSADKENFRRKQEASKS